MQVLVEMGAVLAGREGESSRGRGLKQERGQLSGDRDNVGLQDAVTLFGAQEGGIGS